jgi:hypothetical protein
MLIPERQGADSLFPTGIIRSTKLEAEKLKNSGILFALVI